VNARDFVYNAISKRIAMTRNKKFGDDTHLYTDLEIDSLSFVKILLAAEEAFGIEFSIEEMPLCLRVGTMVGIIEKKRKMKAGE